MNASVTTTTVDRVPAVVSGPRLRQACSRAGADVVYVTSVGRWCRATGEAGAPTASTSHVAGSSHGPAYGAGAAGAPAHADEP